MFKCELCGREFETMIGIGSHISKTHKNEISQEEYYLKFIGEKGKCIECGKDTRYNGLRNGYSIFCSQKCLGKSIEVKNKKKKQI